MTERDPMRAIRAIDTVIDAAIKWREADENDDQHETAALCDAVDFYLDAVHDTGVRA